MQSTRKNMNFFIIISISMIFGILFVSSNSYAQDNSDPSRDVYISVQTFVRNSDGHLVHYFENDKFTHKNFKELHEFLDFEASRGNDPIYDVNGKKFQLIQRTKTIQIDSHQLVASTLLSNSEQPNVDFLVRYAHDGYFLIPGDEINQVWTFLRTIN